MAEENKVNAGTIALVGFVATVLVVEIILLLMVLYYHVAAQQAYEKDISQPAAELVKIETAQRAKLNEYLWADPQKKIVAIPVSRAMKLVVEDLARAEEAVSGTPGARTHHAPRDARVLTRSVRSTDTGGTPVAPGGKEGMHDQK